MWKGAEKCEESRIFPEEHLRTEGLVEEQLVKITKSEIKEQRKEAKKEGK